LMSFWVWSILTRCWAIFLKIFA